MREAKVNTLCGRLVANQTLLLSYITWPCGVLIRSVKYVTYLYRVAPVGSLTVPRKNKTWKNTQTLHAIFLCDIAACNLSGMSDSSLGVWDWALLGHAF